MLMTTFRKRIKRIETNNLLSQFSLLTTFRKRIKTILKNRITKKIQPAEIASCIYL